MGPDLLANDINHRFPIDQVVDLFPEIKFNPFKDRIVKTFSSAMDEKFSFDDVLDFYSAMSINCPVDVKAEWIFRIFDFDDDGLLEKGDIDQICNRLTKNMKLKDEELDKISEKVILRIALFCKI